MGAKIEAAKVQLSVLESMRRLNATDKPQRSTVTHEVADQQRVAAMAAVTAKRQAELREQEEQRREIETLRRQAGVIPGEIIRELPA